MGKHSEWRKLVKKLRRKHIRQQIAKDRDHKIKQESLEREQSVDYKEWLENEEKAEQYRLEEEQRIHEEQERKWIETERIAQKQWKELQKQLTQLRFERARQNAKIKEEWEREQKKLKELEEIRKKEVEEKEKEQTFLKEQISNYISNGGKTPELFRIKHETNPGKISCPFFNKTSACRFGDLCSRNHVRPGISEIILIPNFYSHYGLAQVENEHGSSSLEFESREIQEHFREFFFDVVPELEKCGKIRKFVACCNSEAHLRGNVYVEYSSKREAMKSYQTFNGRWYAGKQLNVYFCEISSWSAAICGLFYRQKCPKGSSCNFIHVFFNPKNLYSGNDERSSRSPSREEHRSERRSEWRWSESPERTHIGEPLVDWEDRIEYSPKNIEKNENTKSNHRRYKSERLSDKRKTESSRSRRKESSRSRRRSHSRSPCYKRRKRV
ncbi:hypothetical protein HHI36_010628 [Cryptolaemus montrouzieri]|uniref:Uncharacterized protein n=1 Tax=Cryptolaemus montrouzieri TaxID=559131 RepID=A0ABD2MK21_9CUCU